MVEGVGSFMLKLIFFFLILVSKQLEYILTEHVYLAFVSLNLIVEFIFLSCCYSEANI